MIYILMTQLLLLELIIKDNIMKLIGNIIDNIYKKDEMDQGRIKTGRILPFLEIIYYDLMRLFFKI